MKKPLNVFYKKSQVGVLTKKADDTLEFQYSPSWMNDQDGFSLSPAIPLQEAPFNNRLTKSYFDNLLPEGDTLKTFEQILKRSFEDPYQLLESYGVDCAGALEITPLEEPPENALNGKVEKLSFEEIDQVIERRESLYVHTLTQHKGRFSLAGAQDKIPVIYKNGELLLPQDASPTTHILKPPTRLSGVYETVFNEYLCMQLAKASGLPTPEVQLIGNEHPLFLIARYDRKKTKHGIERIHQFDLCQAQGIPSAEKYEEDGGPTFAQDYTAVQTISDRKIHDLNLMLRWFSFNLLIGNNDSHSKNMSFLFQKNETTLTPLYDLMSTGVYENMTPNFAFAVGGQKLWHELRPVHFKQMAQALGFSKREDIVIEALLDVCKKIEPVMSTVFDPFIEEHQSSRIAKVLRLEIEKRIREFKRKLR